MKLCSSREELARLPHGPKLVLASLPSLEAGFSRQLFMDWAENPRNAVVFVTPAEEGTLAERVQQLAAEEPQAQAQEQQQGKRDRREAPSMQLVRSHRVALEGQELEERLAAQQAQQEAAAAAAEAAQQQRMEVDAAAAAAEAAAGGGAGGSGLLSPRASGAVPRVSSLAIGHLHSRKGFASVLGEVVGADGLPVEDFQEPTAAAAEACLVEGFVVPQVTLQDSEGGAHPVLRLLGPADLGWPAQLSSACHLATHRTCSERTHAAPEPPACLRAPAAGRGAAHVPV